MKYTEVHFSGIITEKDVQRVGDSIWKIQIKIK